MPPRFAYGAEAASWSGGELGEAARPGRRRDRAAADQRHGALGRGRASCAARCSLREDETGFCSVTWGDGDLGGPAQRPGGARAARLDRRVLAPLAARRRVPRPSLAHPPTALGPRPQGPHLHPDRGDRRRAHHLAAGDAGRRTQLGLPLQLDPRLDLQPLGPAHARLRRGGARLHALHPRRLPRSTPTCRSCTGSAARAT